MIINPKKEKAVVMIAPSFIAQFEYPRVIWQLRELGFDKVVELTFGAKLVNREYHKILEKTPKGKLWISSVCAGIQEFVENQMPQLKDKLMKVDSPMIAMAKICKKEYPKHKVVFIAPCPFKKIEAGKRGKGLINEVICYDEFSELLKKSKVTGETRKIHFNKFYNDYTKIYPLGGGLSKTAHLKGVLKNGEEKIIDNIVKVKKFLENPDKKVKFADVNFCVGGCIGGPCVTKSISIAEKKKKVLKYMKNSLKENIPEDRKGLLDRAKGLKFNWNEK